MWPSLFANLTKCYVPTLVNLLLKLLSVIFYQIFIFSQNDSPLKYMRKVWKGKEKITKI